MSSSNLNSNSGRRDNKPAVIKQNRLRIPSLHSILNLFSINIYQYFVATNSLSFFIKPTYTCKTFNNYF